MPSIPEYPAGSRRTQWQGCPYKGCETRKLKRRHRQGGFWEVCGALATTQPETANVRAAGNGAGNGKKTVRRA